MQTCIAQMGLASKGADMRKGQHTILKRNFQGGSAVQKVSVYALSPIKTSLPRKAKPYFLIRSPGIPR